MFTLKHVLHKNILFKFVQALCQLEDLKLSHLIYIVIIYRVILFFNTSSLIFLVSYKRTFLIKDKIREKKNMSLTGIDILLIPDLTLCTDSSVM